MLTLKQTMLNKDKLYLRVVCKTCGKGQIIKISHYNPEIKIFIKKHGYKRSLGLDKPIECYHCGTLNHYRSNIDRRQLFIYSGVKILLQEPITTDIIEKDLHEFFNKRRNYNDEL